VLQPNTLGVYLPRASSGLGGSVQVGGFDDGSLSVEYPNQPNSGLIVRPSVVMESATRMRGVVRGFRRSVHGSSTGGVFACGQVLAAADGYPGLAICMDRSGVGSGQLGGVFDIVGPW
jgi:hypothetical protein